MSCAMEPEVLSPADLPDLLALCRAAHWNQTEADWRRVLALEPELCLGIRAGGRIVSTAAAVTYSPAEGFPPLAWIGMVLTDPEHRGHGFARRLMTRLTATLDGRGFAVQKLDATSMGLPLYEQLGFLAEQPVERWQRDPSRKRIQASGVVEPFRCDAALDIPAFGWDRSRLLPSLLDAPGADAALTEGGFAMGRPGAIAAYFGPCAARSPLAAKRLANWFLARHHGEVVFWDLLPHNGEAQALARSLGFRPVRTLVRMVRRPPGVTEPPRRDEHIFAIAGFEFG